MRPRNAFTAEWCREECAHGMRVRERERTSTALHQRRESTWESSCLFCCWRWFWAGWVLSPMCCGLWRRLSSLPGSSASGWHVVRRRRRPITLVSLVGLVGGNLASRGVGLPSSGIEGAMGSRPSRQFNPEFGQVAAARRYAIGAAHGWGVEPGELGLVVGELATNAVLHGRTPFTLSLHKKNNRVVVEVEDGNPRLPLMEQEISSSALSGRGLTIVDRLARQWGVRATAYGKVVWAEFDCS